MKILYIPVTKKIKEKNFKNYLKCFLFDIKIILKNFSFNKSATNNTSGFINSAIHSNAFTFELLARSVVEHTGGARVDGVSRLLHAPAERGKAEGRRSRVPQAHQAVGLDGRAVPVGEVWRVD